jgi:large subunit ribosomal protein L6
MFGKRGINMSRIGNKVIVLPEGVTFNNNNNLVTVTGPHGTLERQFSPLVKFTVEGNEIKVSRVDETMQAQSQHGTARSLLANMITGVKEKFQKRLEIAGVGYRAALEGNQLVLNVGYSKPVNMAIPKGINVTLPRNTVIIVEGINRQEVGEFAANIRKVRKPEPYKGKGIRYADEVIRRKEGKTVS